LPNLLESLKDWTAALDEGCGLDILFLDHRKAFDSVSHKRLLKKLRTIDKLKVTYYIGLKIF